MHQKLPIEEFAEQAKAITDKLHEALSYLIRSCRVLSDISEEAAEWAEVKLSEASSLTTTLNLSCSLDDLRRALVEKRDSWLVLLTPRKDPPVLRELPTTNSVQSLVATTVKRAELLHQTKKEFLALSDMFVAFEDKMRAHAMAPRRGCLASQILEGDLSERFDLHYSDEDKTNPLSESWEYPLLKVTYKTANFLNRNLPANKIIEDRLVRTDSARNLYQMSLATAAKDYQEKKPKFPISFFPPKYAPVPLAPQPLPSVPNIWA